MRAGAGDAEGKRVLTSSRGCIRGLVSLEVNVSLSSRQGGFFKTPAMRGEEFRQEELVGQTGTLQQPVGCLWEQSPSATRTPDPPHGKAVGAGSEDASRLMASPSPNSLGNPGLLHI